MNRCTRRILMLILAISVVLSGASMAVEGTVNASALFVRTETSTEAESIGKVYQNDTVDITGRVGEWYIINHGGTSAFVFSEYVDLGNVQVQSSMGTITGKTVNVRTAPGTDNGIAGRLLDGTMVNILAIENGWYKIKFLDLVGYVHPDYLSVDGLVFTYVSVDGEGTATTSYTSRYTNAAASPICEQIINYAYGYLGTLYTYGGETPEEGFDCSGFTQYVFAEYGYKLKRSASDQYSNGEAVAYDDLQPGDLVFFSRGSKPIGHVGIYVGDGYFIHATSPGDVVRVTAMSTEYYTARYVGARRVAMA